MQMCLVQVCLYFEKTIVAKKGEEKTRINKKNPVANASCVFRAFIESDSKITFGKFSPHTLPATMAFNDLYTPSPQRVRR